MPERRNVLTPEALAMIDTIARSGSFAAAAREMGKVPSALTYSVRQLEDALDVLLFDRSSRQARPTAAGEELLAEGRRLLQEMDAVANRVRRVASGWETELAISVEDIVSQTTIFELVEAFCGVCGLEGATGAAAGAAGSGPATRLRLRSDVLAGTWEALVSGHVDLAIGVGGDFAHGAGIETRPLGPMEFVFCVAPHHPLARRGGGGDALGDAELVHHRAVAVADSAQRLNRITVNLLPGQDVLTVASMRAKLEALLRGLGCGYLPEPWARPHLETGRLVALPTARGERKATLHYAWRAERGRAGLGRALQWWLAQLERPATRKALVERQAGTLA
ncbi:MAG: LysR family transcriptional regulator [Burkholderiales bacterium]|nr:LysR family transcriptional regulator [Burkholderiales bacterium]